MDRRTRHKLPDGRYFILVQVTPFPLYHLHDAFGNFICALPVEAVSLGETVKEAAENEPPRKG